MIYTVTAECGDTSNGWVDGQLGTEERIALLMSRMPAGATLTVTIRPGIWVGDKQVDA